MSDRKSREKSRVDPSETFPQVKKSRGPVEKVTRTLPRKVTFSGLSLGRPERDFREGTQDQETESDPAALRREALARLARAHRPRETP